MAAIELALILSAVMMLLPVTFLFGRVFYQYSVIKQATHAAAAYVASLQAGQVKNSAAALAASVKARLIVVEAIRAAGIAPVPDASSVTIECDSLVCGGAIPSTVYAGVRLTINDFDFSGYTQPWLDGDSRWSFDAGTTVSYAH
ncbi:MAG: TadE family protein [Pseudomonadota bacterium]